MGKRSLHSRPQDHEIVGSDYLRPRLRRNVEAATATQQKSTTRAVTTMLDPYKILGVPKDASPEQLEAAYREKLFKHQDRKSTRLNSSHPSISYAVFCLK